MSRLVFMAYCVWFLVGFDSELPCYPADGTASSRFQAIVSPSHDEPPWICLGRQVTGGDVGEAIIQGAAGNSLAVARTGICTSAYFIQKGMNGEL